MDLVLPPNESSNESHSISHRPIPSTSTAGINGTISRLFTLRMDEFLRNAVASRLHRGGRRWDIVANLLAASSGGTITTEDCSKRWQLLKEYSGLEYKTLVPNQSKGRRLGRRVPTREVVRKEKTKLNTVNEKKKEEKDSQEIVIHVCDEARKVTRDFSCQKHVLLKGMGYFKNYLSDGQTYDDIDISVHCDVHVFDWLMRFLKQEQPPPQLGVKNIVSILISSEFLQMDQLVQESITYFCNNLQEILQYPIDLSCINSNLLTQITKRFTYEQLDTIQDPNDKLLSKFYQKKLEEMLSFPQNQLALCSGCGTLFTSSQQSRLVCPSAKLHINYNGVILARHSALLAPQTQTSAWDLHQCLVALRSRHVSWEDIFWKFWALVHDLQCTRCHQRFVLADLGHCSYHSLAPKFAQGTHSGVFPCCDTPVLRFDTLMTPTGCRARNHTVDTDNEDRRRLEILFKRKQVILRSYKSPGIQQELSMLGLVNAAEMVDQFGKEEQSLTSERSRSNGREEDHEGESISSERVSREYQSDSDLSQSDSDEERHTIKSTKLKRTTIAFQAHSEKHENVSKEVRSRPSTSKKSTKTNRRKKVGIAVNPMSPAKRRAHRMDSLREDDRRRMDSLVHQLRSMREDKPKEQTKDKPQTTPLRTTASTASLKGKRSKESHKPKGRKIKTRK